MALEAASKAFRASTVCAEAVPANRMNSPARMQNLRAIRFPRSHKFNRKNQSFISNLTSRMGTLIHPWPPIRTAPIWQTNWTEYGRSVQPSPQKFAAQVLSHFADYI